MVVPNCLHGRRDSAHLEDEKCTCHFTPLAQRTVGDLVLIIDYLCYGEVLSWLPWRLQLAPQTAFDTMFKHKRICVVRHFS